MISPRPLAKKINWPALWLIFVFSVLCAVGFGKKEIGADLRKGMYARPLAMAWVARHGQPCAYLAKGGDGAYGASPPGKLLASADAGGYAYLVKHRVTVALVPGHLLEGCEHAAPDRHTFSANLIGTSVVLLNQDRLRSDAAKAAALSHEVVHVRYGDEREPAAHRSFVSQLWLSEEADAHRRGLETGEKLGAEGLPSRVAEDVNYVYALPLHLAMCAFFVGIGACPLLYAAREKRMQGHAPVW